MSNFVSHTTITVAGVFAALTILFFLLLSCSSIISTYGPAAYVLPVSFLRKQVAENPFKGRRRVVILAINNNPFYAFFAPITAWAWKTRIGFDPVVLLTEDVHPLIREKIEEVGGLTYTVNHNLPPIRGGSVQQVARVLASILPFDGDTQIMTADADMIPLRRDYFFDYNPAYKFHVFNAFATMGGKQYPICYMLGSADTWRHIIGSSENDTIASYVDRLVEQHGELGFSRWSFDQRFIFKQVQTIAQDNAMFVEHIHFTGTRLDRIDIPAWEGKYRLTDIDSHALRPGFTQENWPKIVSTLLRYIMPPEILEWANEYREQFVQQVRLGDYTLGNLVDGMGRKSRAT